MKKHYMALNVGPHRLEVCGPGVGDVLHGFPCGMTEETLLRLLEDAYSAGYAAGADATLRTVLPEGSAR